MDRFEKFETTEKDDPDKPKTFTMTAVLLPGGVVQARLDTSNLTSFQEIKLLASCINKIALLQEDELQKLKDIGLNEAEHILEDVVAMVSTIKDAASVIERTFQTVSRL